jgi:hypothetical protein
MTDKTSDAIKLNLRLPKPLHKRLKQQARRNNVSLNTQIVNQLEGSETATAKRMAEAIRPLVADAVETAVALAVAHVTQNLPVEDEVWLDMLVAGPEGDAVPIPPRTETDLKELLRRMRVPPDRTANLLQIFRERQARTRPSAGTRIGRRGSEQK